MLVADLRPMVRNRSWCYAGADPHHVVVGGFHTGDVHAADAGYLADGGFLEALVLLVACRMDETETVVGPTVLARARLSSGHAGRPRGPQP